MRDIGQRFNSLLGETFVLPEAWIPPAGARIMALDEPTQKMSKSAGRPGSSVSLTEPAASIAKKVKAAVTDSGREVKAAPDKPALSNLLTILSLAEGTPVGDLEERFADAGYGDFKAAVAEALIERLRPIRERYEELMGDPGEVERLLAGGAAKARQVAEQTMGDVRSKAGLLGAR
jgi:tryptophanyl-tRNA synthetase